MKYYKLLTKLGYNGDCFIIGKIYQESYREKGGANSVKFMSEMYPNDLQEVTPGEYFVQEGKMPEYFAIKRVEDNPLWEKYICWLNKKYLTNWSGNIDHCFYGFGKDKTTHGACASMKNFGEDSVKLTLEQWDKIINKTMEEEFELPEKWCTRIDKQKVVDYCNVHGLYPPYKIIEDGTTYAHFPGWNDCTTCNGIKSGYTEITYSQFIKYVLNKEVMEENKEIIGWKLKEDCEQYKKACVPISSLSVYPELMGYYCVRDNNVSICNFKQAGVLDLWFEPVYKEEFKVGDWVYITSAQSGAKGADNKVGIITNKPGETGLSGDYPNGINVDLSGIIWTIGKNYSSIKLRKATPEEIEAAQTLRFGGYDVAFEKVTSGVRISFNGETGTFSQIQAIYNYFKPNSIYFRFGSQEVRKVIYDKKEWNIAPDDDEPTSIRIGCTIGDWKEFVAIYEKAKSML